MDICTLHQDKQQKSIINFTAVTLVIYAKLENVQQSQLYADQIIPHNNLRYMRIRSFRNPHRIHKRLHIPVTKYKRLLQISNGYSKCASDYRAN